MKPQTQWLGGTWPGPPLRCGDWRGASRIQRYPHSHMAWTGTVGRDRWLHSQRARPSSQPPFDYFHFQGAKRLTLDPSSPRTSCGGLPPLTDWATLRGRLGVLTIPSQRLPHRLPYYIPNTCVGGGVGWEGVAGDGEGPPLNTPCGSGAGQYFRLLGECADTGQNRTGGLLFPH